MTTPFKFAILAPALLLGGCLSFGGDPPESMLTLTPDTMAPAGTGGSSEGGSALALVEFEAPRSLDVTRIPVQVTDTEIAYLKDAVWVEKPARLFRRLIAETIRTRSNRVVIDGDDPGALANNRLSGTLRKFGYDARSGSVVIIFDAVRPGPSSGVETQRFEAVVPGVQGKASSIGPALNQAANDVAGQVADWVS